MSVTIRGQVGPQSLQDGAEQALRTEKSGALVVQELHARYYEQAYRASVFTAVNAASTSSAALAATYTGGVCVSNPAGSRVNLAILKVSIAYTVVSVAVTTAGLAGGWAQGGITVHTTPLTPFSNLIGTGPLAVAKADQAATLVGTPTWILPGIAATGSATSSFGVTIDVEGSIIVPPGGYVCTATSIASVASAMLCGISWEEVPV